MCCAGFVADHLEMLYDLDIEAKQIAEEAGIAFARTRMPNADPEYLDVLATGRARPPGAGAGGVSAAGVRRVAVVGGGVSGLTVAYRLARADPASTSRCSRPATRPGGKLGSVEVGGLDLPAGADSFLARKPWAVELCKELGLDLEAPGASGAWLWTDTGLVPLPKDAPFGIPGDVGDLFRWPGLSAAGKRRAAQDLVRQARKGDDDESLGSLLAAAARRRGDRPRGRPAARRAVRRRRRPAERAGDVPRARGVGARAGEPDPRIAGDVEARAAVAARPDVRAAPRRRASAHRRLAERLAAGSARAPR